MSSRRALPMLLMTGLALAGCGENEVATSHIRTVIEAAAPTGAQAGTSPSDAPDGADAGSATPVVTLPNGDTLTVRPSVVAFYRDRGFRPAWTDDDEILGRGLSMLEAIGTADAEGLDRERYHFSTAREMADLLDEDAVEDRELEYLGNLDILLTENFARLAQDLAAGTLDPERAGLTWRIERGQAPESSLIDAVMEGEDPKAVLAGVRPRVPYYDRMVEALARLRTVEADGGWSTVPEGEALEEGAEGPRVAALRARLMAGDDPEETRLAKAGERRAERFDPELRQALEHFQTRHNLQEDGALGPNTLTALNVPVAERIEALRLNLDRWRWLPRDLGERFILVNVAGFELEVVEGDSAIESMDVVVGATAHQTPIFQDTLEHMVVNPYWNVPESIAEEEIIPAALEDPTYLERNDYELVRDGNAIAPSSVPAAELTSGDYRIRQKPGDGNALGHVKFIFPNANDIYLHDTPADNLFSQRSRAFSHGCIRVERPADLARTLLATLTDRDPSAYESLRQAEGEQWVPFDPEIPVYILYFTAWVDEDGTIRFHDDVYDRDATLESERRQKLDPVEPRPIAAVRPS
ncbi:MAG: L,D-transpeptidase family protein [Gemmatimonadota bacterium]